MTGSNNNIKSKQHFYSDLSFWSLLIANIITIAWALIEGWSLSLMIWVYFSQNVILGIFWPVKVFDSAADSSYTKKMQSIAVFLPLYLVIHFTYATWLYTFISQELFVHFKCILTMAGIFFLSETISYFSKYSSNRARPLSLAKVQLFPYARVVPMTFVMIIGIFVSEGDVDARFGIAGSLVLKALADIAMYMVERSTVFGDLVSTVSDDFVTYMLEMPRERGGLGFYSSSGKEQTIYRKEKKEVCHFCQRVIGRSETPWVIKEHVVCEECYKKIEKYKRKNT